MVVLPSSLVGVGCELEAVMLSFGTGPRQVLLSREGDLLEVNIVQRKLGSWLAGEAALCEGGRLFLATPVDVVLALLPLLERQKERFRPLDDVLHEEGGGYAVLAARGGGRLAQACRAVCETKAIPGVEGTFVRLSREKTFRWLLAKTEQTRAAVAAGKAGRNAAAGSGRAVSRSLVVEERATRGEEEKEGGGGGGEGTEKKKKKRRRTARRSLPWSCCETMWETSGDLSCCDITV